MTDKDYSFFDEVLFLIVIFNLPEKGIRYYPQKPITMMPEKLNKVTLRGLHSRFSGWKAAPFVLLLLKGNTVLAQSSSSSAKTGTDFSAGEVLVLIAGIVLLILVAWFFGSGQSKGEPPVHNHPHKHYEHPNDPHFRKLKKKTS